MTIARQVANEMDVDSRKIYAAKDRLVKRGAWPEGNSKTKTRTRIDRSDVVRKNVSDYTPNQTSALKSELERMAQDPNWAKSNPDLRDLAQRLDEAQGHLNSH